MVKIAFKKLFIYVIHEVHTKYAYKFDKIIVSSSKYN